MAQFTSPKHRTGEQVLNSLQAFSLCPTINSPKHHYKIGPLKTHYSEHHKTIMALHLIKDCLWTLVLRAFDDSVMILSQEKTVNDRIKPSATHVLLWTLQYVPTTQSWSQVTTYGYLSLWCVLQTDHKYVKTRDYILTFLDLICLWFSTLCSIRIYWNNNDDS